MILERTKDEIVVRLSANVDLTELQNMLDYLQYKELTAQSTANFTDAEDLTAMTNQSMWSKVKAQRISR